MGGPNGLAWYLGPCFAHSLPFPSCAGCLAGVGTRTLAPPDEWPARDGCPRQKPENILMRANGHIALTDFDLSKQAHAVSPRVVQQQLSLMDKMKHLALSKGSRASSALNLLDIVDSEPVLSVSTTSFVGTEEYISPEVRGCARAGCGPTAADVWMAGVGVLDLCRCSVTARREVPLDRLQCANGPASCRVLSVGPPRVLPVCAPRLTPCPFSPTPVQVVNGNAQSSAVDWWTLGILVYEVCRFSAAPVVPCPCWGPPVRVSLAWVPCISDSSC